MVGGILDEIGKGVKSHNRVEVGASEGGKDYLQERSGDDLKKNHRDELSGGHLRSSSMSMCSTESTIS